jgi:hypothetical protein
MAGAMAGAMAGCCAARQSEVGLVLCQHTRHGQVQAEPQGGRRPARAAGGETSRGRKPLQAGRRGPCPFLRADKSERESVSVCERKVRGGGILSAIELFGVICQLLISYS